MGTEEAKHRGERSGDFLGGKYLLEDCLGVGGMGEVYRAMNVSLGRRVAIKVLGRDMVDNEDDVMRFLREARAAAAVRHPNVVDVLDVARDDDGTPFIVQELLAGEDLERYARSRGGKLSVDEALEILIPVADAVAAAHARDVVHRDLKPANIFLSSDGSKITPKVLDFGACLFPTMGGIDEKELRMLIGTPHYMAPEQVTSRTDIDARADVWALGVILWELIVGDVPFQGATAMDVLRLVKTQDVPPLAAVAPDAPPELAELVSECTRRDKADRLPSATLLAHRMRSMREARQSSARGSIDTLPDLEPGGAASLASPATPPTPVTPRTQPSTRGRPTLETGHDLAPSGLDLAFAEPRRSSHPPSPGGPRPSSSREAVAGGVASSSRVAPVTVLRTPRTPVPPVAAPPAPELSRRELGRLAALVLGPAVVLHAALRLVPLTSPLGRALRGDSMVASGIVTVIALVVAAALAAKSLAPDGRRSIAVAAAGALALGIVMIIVTFSAGEAAELGNPPAASGLVPFVAPILPFALGLSMFARARAAWPVRRERRRAIAAAVAASLLLLTALEVGPTGAVRSAPPASGHARGAL